MPGSLITTTSFRPPAVLQRALAIVLAGGIAALSAAGGARAAELPGVFNGNAYATVANAKAGPLTAILARGAFQGCACQGTGGKVKTTEIDSISVGPVFSVNKTISSVYTKKTASTAEVRNASSVEGLSALGGLITADAITSVATVDATKKTVSVSSDGSGFGNLTIAGQQIPVTVPPNTVVPLPGIGSVTLNKIATHGNLKKSGSIDVEMISVDVKVQNGLGLPVGAKIVVAHAIAGFNRKEPPAAFDGQAYAVTGNAALGDDLNNKIGRAAFLTIGCQGTHGRTETNSIAGRDINGLLNTGDGETTAFAGPEGDAQVARTTSTVSSVGLLSGLIQVNALQAVATSSLTNGKSTGSADGSGFSGLTIAGVNIPVTIPPNTTLPLPLLGTVTVNEQTVKTDGSVTVNGLHIKVTTPNLFGLPVGAELTVAHASASAAPL
ncbi:MAG TPA: choice-of-anchor P family protein [Rhizomicrobium sp.]|nr:choice-of-anchor P family protein [Rhizomicrobium sp.]